LHHLDHGSRPEESETSTNFSPAIGHVDEIAVRQRQRRAAVLGASPGDPVGLFS
jgi:hypothetical protein